MHLLIHFFFCVAHTDYFFVYQVPCEELNNNQSLVLVLQEPSDHLESDRYIEPY
jgi:hypothetical protein